MPKFYKDSLSTHDLHIGNDKTKLNSIINLIEGSSFKKDILELFSSINIDNESTSIKGVDILVSNIITRAQEFQKKDIKSHISNVKCIKTSDNEVFLYFNKEKITAKPVYSAKREYFEGTYKMNKFADFCITSGYFDLLESNIDYLNAKYKDSEKHIKNFRLLKDREQKYYVRAITSVSSYNDYGIKFSLFVTIMTLHNINKKTNIHFDINRAEYSESFIRIFFKKKDSISIPNIGKLSFALKMSNDEIKREAFKFSGLFTLMPEGSSNYIHLQPKKLQTKIISIKHNFTLETVLKHLEDLELFIKEAEDEMKEDIKQLDQVENPDQLRFILLRKIERSLHSELLEFKPTIRKTLDVKINQIHDLLLLMDKVNQLVTNLEGKEYLRYLYYEILRDAKK